MDLIKKMKNKNIDNRYVEMRIGSKANKAYDFSRKQKYLPNFRLYYIYLLMPKLHGNFQ